MTAQRLKHQFVRFDDKVMLLERHSPEHYIHVRRPDVHIRRFRDGWVGHVDGWPATEARRVLRECAKLVDKVDPSIAAIADLDYGASLLKRVFGIPATNVSEVIVGLIEANHLEAKIAGESRIYTLHAPLLTGVHQENISVSFTITHQGFWRHPWREVGNRLEAACRLLVKKRPWLRHRTDNWDST